MKCKKLMCIIMSVAVIFGCISVGVGATNGLKSELITTDKNSGNVTFDSPYAEIGKEISVLVDGENSEDLVYEWYINNERIENTASSYTPQWCDLEMMMSVKVYKMPGGSFVGNVSMLISELPVVYIETQDREPIVIKSKTLDAHMKIQGNEEYNDESLLYDDATEIKGRGNATWQDDKKPYKLKLDSKSDLFGMGKNKHWVLLSNPFDNTYARNILSYNLAGEMGLDYQQYVSVELVLNGAHVGNYLLCEHVRVDETRVDITNWDDIAEDAAKAIYKGNKDTMTKDERDELIDIMTDETKDWVTSDVITYNGVTYTVSDYYEVPDINGGYLLCFDDEDANFISKNNVPICVDRPEVVSDDMYNEITGYYQAFEDALYSDDYCTEYNGQTMRYTEFIDIESFAKGLLLNEIFENADFGLRSTYMYKDVDGKFVFGPVWDMDLSSGRSDLSGLYFYHNKWHTLKVKWLERLYSDPYFLKEVYNVYWEYRYTAIADIIKKGGMLDKTHDLISESANRDEEIWAYSNSFDYEYDNLTQWMNNRIQWLDSQFASLLTLYSSMSYRFSNKVVSNPENMQLSLNQDTLEISISDDRVKSVSLYTDGAFINNYKIFGNTLKYSVKSISEGSLVQAIAYDENSNPVCGNFITKEKQITSLDVKSLPDKLDYNVGDELDLTGLVLEATYSDSSKETVTPDAAITYAKDAVGTQYFNSYNIVTDTIGDEIYVSLKYKNAQTEFKINVAPRENHEEVEKLISKFPCGSFDEDYFEDVITAKLAFDALSDDAKEKVSNKENLEKAMNYIDTLSSSDSGVIACYLPEIYQNGYVKNNFVIVVKGTPWKLRFIYNDANTITFYNSPDISSTLLSVKEVGDYSIWTCNLTPRDYKIYTISYEDVDSETKDFDLTKYADPVDKISSVEYQKSVFENGTVSFDIETDKQFEELRITENGNVIKSATAVVGNNTIEIIPDSVGTHTYSLEYKFNDCWIKYDDFDVFVREEAINMILGDVDINNKINSSDALFVLQYATGLIELTDRQVKCADVECDSKINSSDALKILLYSTGQINKF